MSSGTLSLNSIGSTTTNLSYVFPNGFKVASGAELIVGANVPVALPASEQLTVEGTLSFSNGDVVTVGTGAQILVTGSLSSIETTFNAGGGGANITINSGGTLLADNETIFDLSDLTLNSGAIATLTSDVLHGVFTINSNTTLDVTGNDFSNLTTPKGLVAAGEQGATINVAGNYWGTTVAGIDAIIDDSNDNSSLPTVNFQPYVNYASGTSASPAAATFSTSSQTFNLTATVTTTAGLVISEGTESFAIYNGTTQIGQTTTAVQVENGSATASYTLPAGTPAGLYTVAAYYSGSDNYLPSTDLNHFLTVGPAPTTTSVGSASATFSAATDQTLTFSAQVGSAAGTINEGSVTFTVLSGGNPVGASVVAAVQANVASTSYKLLKGTPGGSYTIQAVYSDPDSFKTSTGTNQLSVTAAATNIAVSGTSAAFSAIAGEGTTLSASVTSSAGTINEGIVTFTVFNGSTQIAGPFNLSVSGGVAGGNVSLPAGTLIGSYTLSAVFNGTASFAASLPNSSTLTISAPASSIAATAASTQFGAASQTVPLIATVTSAAGTVSEGNCHIHDPEWLKPRRHPRARERERGKCKCQLHAAGRHRHRQLHDPCRLYRHR